MATRKEDEIKIPESVLRQANTAMRQAEVGSPFTQRERTEMGIPQFPFGGLKSTMMDTPFGSGGTYNREDLQRTDRNIQYERDVASRVAGRYTLPTTDVARRNISFGEPFGGRLQSTLYSDPESALSLEKSNLRMGEGLGSLPTVGSSGLERTSYRGENEIQQIVSPYGSASTTINPEQDSQRRQARQQAQEKGTMPRTPEEQQALLARMRQQGSQIRERIASSARDSFVNKPEPTPTYTTPTGSSIKAPTNMYGQPIASWANIYEKSSAVNEAALAAMGRGKSTTPSLNAGILGATGFGAMQREQAAQTPVPIRSASLFGGMGYAAAFGGGPQPAQSMLATSPEDQRRRRIFGMG